MKDLSMEQLTSQYLDVLKELGNIGAGNATTALAQMIGCKVDMSVPQVKLLEFNELTQIVGGEDEIMVGIYLQVEGDVEGSMMFILKKGPAAHLVNKLMCGMLGVTNEEIMKYELEEDFSIETAVEFGRLYRRNGQWKFEAIGVGQKHGLQEYLNKYN